jgi:transcriptional regulator with XRE-family HTH domain
MKSLDEARVAAKRLRRERRLSIKEIAERLGQSVSTVYGWVRHDPLSTSELSDRHKKGPTDATTRTRGEESRFSIAAGENLTRETKCRIAESAVLFRLTLRGLRVYSSEFDGDRVDWLVDVSGKFEKIQVKWLGAVSHGLPAIKLLRAKGHSGQTLYTDNDFDFIVGYWLFNDTAYVYSREEVRAHRVNMVVDANAAERWDKITRPSRR